MRLVELAVRPVMGRCGHGTGWGNRADNFAVPGEWGGEFDTYLKVDLMVPVNRDVPTCPCDLLGADDTPNRATGVWNDPGEFLHARAAAHNGQRMTVVLIESDVVFHAKFFSNTPSDVVSHLIFETAIVAFQQPSLAFTASNQVRKLAASAASRSLPSRCA